MKDMLKGFSVGLLSLFAILCCMGPSSISGPGTNFSGSFTGDVTGTQNATVVASVGAISGASLTNLLQRGYRTPSDYGAQGNGHDDTAAFQAAAYSGIPTYLPANSNYTTGNIFLTNNSCFFSAGATWILNANTNGPLLQGTNGITNIIISGITFSGGLVGFNDTGSPRQRAWGFTAQTNVIQKVTADRSAIVINGASTNSYIINNTITGFSDWGILVNQGIGAFGVPTNGAIIISGNLISRCWIGLSCSNGAEYANISYNNIYTCGNAYWKASGNFDILGGSVNANGCAFRVQGEGVTNPGHGKNVGVNANHNEIGAVCTSLGSGEEFDNCFWLGGGDGGGGNGFFVTNSRQITVNGGRMGGTFIIVDGGGNTLNGTNFFNPADFGAAIGVLPSQVFAVNSGLLFVGSANSGGQIVGGSSTINSNLTVGGVATFNAMNTNTSGFGISGGNMVVNTAETNLVSLLTTAYTNTSGYAGIGPASGNDGFVVNRSGTNLVSETAAGLALIGATNGLSVTVGTNKIVATFAGTDNTLNEFYLSFNVTNFVRTGLTNNILAIVTGNWPKTSNVKVTMTPANDFAAQAGTGQGVYWYVESSTRTATSFEIRLSSGQASTTTDIYIMHFLVTQSN